MVDTGQPVSVKSGGDGSTTRYTRIPLEVLSDERLKALDIRVFGAVAIWAFQGKTARVGTRWIAETVHAERGRVLESIGRLIQFGHLQIADAAKGKRTAYLITSPVFGQRQGKEEIVVRGKSGGKVLASVEAVA